MRRKPNGDGAPASDSALGIPNAPWRWPLDVAAYDRTPALSDGERDALTYLCTRHVGRSAGPWPAHLGVALARLARPLNDTGAALHLSAHRRCKTTRVLLRETWRRDAPLWAWTVEDWVAVIGPTMPAFLARHGTRAHVLRQPVLGVAYLLADFAAFDRFPGHSVELTTLAHNVFGPARMADALARVMSVLRAWGYAPSVQGRLHTALAYALLRARSPRLDALTRDTLGVCYEAAHAEAARHSGAPSPLSALALLYPLARALAHLGIIAAPIARHGQRVPIDVRLSAPSVGAASRTKSRRDVAACDVLTTGVAAEWVGWCLAWHARAVLSPGYKQQVLYTLLQVGRWLARAHPAVTSPAQWDYDLAADFVAAVDQRRTEQWRAVGRPPSGGVPPDKPLMPRTKAGILSRARRFFLDLQEVPHRAAGASSDAPGSVLPRRFDPRRALRTPRAIRQLIGPDPRVIDDQWWLKLLHAAETLEAADLGRARRAMYPVELVRAVAVTWVLSGLRGDELRRLRVGCVRTDGAWDDLPAGDTLPTDAVCVLSVPVHKTGTAFAKPVHALVGRRIAEWERVRPPQALTLDPKTQERVHFLFAVRQRPIGPAYLNLRLIPLLCRKANVPPLDARGRITAHRARATLASALYNAPNGLTLDELGEWLGHRDLRATQHYAKLHPTRLVRAVARASQQARLVRVLLDPAAAGRGEPALFYDLGAGAYCANPAWAACPHRLACLKCPMYVPRDVAQRIEARDGVQRLLQEVPLTDEERAVAEGDVVALTRYIAERRDVPPPPVPAPAYVFNARACTPECACHRSESGPLAG